MSNYYDDDVRQQREERLNRMKREKERQLAFRKRFKLYFSCTIIALCICIAGFILVRMNKHALAAENREKKQNENISEMINEDKGAEIVLASEIKEEDRIKEIVEDEAPEDDYSKSEIDLSGLNAHKTDATKGFSEEIVSERGLVVDIKSGEIMAQRGYRDKISPASMTKILTVLTAAEYVDNLDDTIEMTAEITDYGFKYDCSSVGFEKGEKVTVRDLLYGTILPSGADAAVGLATYVAGSQEAFVELMNEKVKQLGLSDTSHFTNCVGVYDDNLYSTTYDIAMILEAAISNPLLRDVLSAHTYTTSRTEQHPDGITVSNWFLRRIEDKDTGGEVMCAKTGYVVQSKNCAASYQIYDDGREYICVTAGSTSSWRCIYDHVELYNQCK